MEISVHKRECILSAVINQGADDNDTADECISPVTNAEVNALLLTFNRPAYDIDLMSFRRVLTDKVQNYKAEILCQPVISQFFTKCDWFMFK